MKYREVAELVASESDSVAASASVAAGLAVLAGIAAADAACCGALGRRGRGQDHKQAVALLAQIEPGGREVSRHLERLLDVKDAAHYGVINVRSAELRRALRSAERLVEFARDVLARG
ncbi:hypothetical protein [Jiangella asiatica]|uniref:HEPN domain-containing protein n=1 Tax=Jiangella asiatica TaxID=2530372 RepID=A0A4R5DQP1_9ACTN|nr:hypothetical protein [Jiangella asiatica]TDE15987.1 hypothetical protein E1269_01475 [Jiangella asiatica]